jgi:hypothetical protein
MLNISRRVSNRSTQKASCGATILTPATFFGRISLGRT